jgi:hypothetical protein
MVRLFVKDVGVFGALRMLMRVFLSRRMKVGLMFVLRGIGSLEAT